MEQTKNSLSLLFNNPDIPEHDRVSVILQKKRIRFRTFTMATGGTVRQFKVIMNDNTVVLDGRSCVRCFLPSASYFAAVKSMS